MKYIKEVLLKLTSLTAEVLTTRLFISDQVFLKLFILTEPEKCQVFSLAYEWLKNLQSFQKILTKYIETKKAVTDTHCLFLTKTNKDNI